MMRCAEHMATAGKKGRAYRTLVGNLKVKGPMKDIGASERIILKWILKR
jgi:hypothetical protein